MSDGGKECAAAVTFTNKSQSLVLSYYQHSLCPTFNSGNNFMDPERPSYISKECHFLSLSQSLGTSPGPFSFELPHFIELNEAMRKRLALNRTNATIRYHLPPTFAEENSSYFQSLFIPWKEPSKARVDYFIKATVTWHKKSGMGRLLGSSREKR